MMKTINYFLLLEQYPWQLPADLEPIILRAMQLIALKCQTTKCQTIKWAIWQLKMR